MRLLALGFLACDPTETTGDSSDVDPVDTSGDTAEGSSPWAADSHAGCTLDVAYDQADDGSTEQTEFSRWDEREDDDGQTEAVEYAYESVEGDFLRWTVEYGDELWCAIAAESSEQTDSDSYASRYTATCDDHAEWTDRVTESLVDDAWEPYSTSTYSYAYDEDDHLVEEVRQTDYADPDSDDTSWRVAYAYAGELLVEYTVYFDDEHYYTVAYEYDEAGNIVAAVITLGEYFGGDEGEVYSSGTYTWDERGNALSSDVEFPYNGDPSEHDRYTWDEHDRYLSFETWTGDDALHQSYAYTWDEAYYRVVALTYDDGDDPENSYVGTVIYSDGGWPWSGTVSHDFTSEGVPDDAYTLAYACPG